MIKEKVKEQFMDLRRFNKLTSNGEEPQLESHLEICLLLGIPYYKKNKVAFQLPFWDVLEKYPLLGNHGNLVPNRFYMLATTLGIKADELFAFGYNNVYNKLYEPNLLSDEIFKSHSKIIPSFLEVPIDATRFGANNSLVITTLFNPYPTLLELYETEGKIYSANEIYKNFHGAIPKLTALKEKVLDGFNPMFGLYTPKHKWDILDITPTSDQLTGRTWIQ